MVCTPSATCAAASKSVAGTAEPPWAGHFPVHTTRRSFHAAPVETVAMGVTNGL